MGGEQLISEVSVIVIHILKLLSYFTIIPEFINPQEFEFTKFNEE